MGPGAQEPGSVEGRAESRLSGIVARKTTLLLTYALTACCAFPITEALVLGPAAPQYAHDVFDEGVVTRLGVIAPDWSSHGFTLWNPYLTGGNAWLAQFGQPPLSVDVLSSAVLPPFWAYALTYFLIILAAGLAMHLFLRDSLALPPVACLAGGLVFQLGFWHYVLGFAVALLPGMLWLADRELVGARGRARYLAAGVLLATFLFYNSHAQLTVLVAVVQLAYIGLGSASRRWQRARDWLLAWLLGAALYGPVLLTQLQYLGDSQRAIWNLEYMVPTTLGAIARKMVALYGSVVIGVPLTSWLGHSPLTYGTFFAGVAGLPLLAICLLKSKRTPRERFLLLLPLGVVLAEVVYLTSLAVAPWQEHLGVLKSFQVTRVRHFIPFALAANIAVGLQALRRGELRRLGAPAGWSLWLLLAILIGWQGWASAVRLARLPAAESLAEMVRPLGWTLAVLYFVVAAVAWLATSLKRGVVLRATATGLSAVAGGLLLVLLVERSVYARIEHLVEPRLDSFERAVEATPGIRYLLAEENGQAYRVLGVDEHPNRLMFSRLYVANGYQQIYPLRYHQLFVALTAPHLEKDRWAHDYIHQWGNRTYVYGPELDLEIASLMGIKWIYSLGTSFGNGALVERFRGEREAVYENPEVFPRAFLVHALRAFADRRQLLEALSDATAAELRARAYVLGASGLELRSEPDGQVSDSSAEIVEYTPDRVIVEARTADPAVLVLTDVNAPGWRAFVNGAETKIFDVYNVFRGVRLPAGAHRVEYRYLPAATARGARLAVAALFIAAAWLLAMARLGRRRRRPPTGRSDRPPAPEAR